MIIGLGLDAADLARVRDMYERKGERLMRRLLTPAEAEYCLAQPDPVPHVAARLAAKEAVFKALAGTVAARGIGWRDAEVERGWDGRPSLRLHGLAAERAAALGVTSVWVSLTHSGVTAVAVVVLEGTGG